MGGRKGEGSRVDGNCVSLHVFMTDIQIPGTPTTHRMRLSLSCSKYTLFSHRIRLGLGILYLPCPKYSHIIYYNSLGLGCTQLGFMDIVLVWTVEGYI